MKKLKEFIKKKQLDHKFKKLGDGYQLAAAGSGQGPSRPMTTGNSHAHASGSTGEIQQQQRRTPRSDADLIAAAAEKRLQRLDDKKDPLAGLTPMQKIVKMQAKKELDEEQKKLAQQMESVSTKDQQPKEDNFTPNVFYTCEIFDEDVALPKSEMMSAIEGTLYENLSEDPISSSIWLIHTLNREEPRLVAVDTIRKYLQNIIDHPDESKYLQIKLSNRVFKEKVETAKGSLEFLKAVGFRTQTRNENGSTETYLVMPSPPDTRAIADNLKSLIEGKPISIRVFRNPKVFVIDPTKPLPNPHIPRDFFKRTTEEIRREQQQRNEALEQMTALRTQRMREMDSKKKELGNSPYKYCYIRIRFPNNYLLQGIFNVYEKFAAVREFVFQHINVKHGMFSLTIAASSINKHEELHEEKNLLEYGLVPSALIHFSWEPETLASFSNLGEPISYLIPEMEANAQLLN